MAANSLGPVSLQDEIARRAPMRLADYMALSNAAYYAAHDPFADFITAPEISQVFGELIGVWLADCWGQLGAPQKFSLVELGPGRGTLMTDAMRVMRRVPGMSEAVALHFLESSPAMRARQAKAFPAVRFIERLQDLPALPSLVLANEFFDCLPVRQFLRRADGLHEHLVVADADGALALAPASEITDARGLFIEDAPEGAILEVSPPALSFAEDLARQLNLSSGAALIIDYGRRHAIGASVQAVHAHRAVGILSEPGAIDLTAHVDFAALGRAAARADAIIHGPVGQGDFLRRLGIDARCETLARANPDAATSIEAARHRLTAPAEMGDLFQCMAISSTSALRPLGFE